jgi:subtilisin family serine protease
MEPIRTEFEDFVDNQFAVDLPFKDLVVSTLSNLDIPVRPQATIEDTDKKLGLALITLEKGSLTAAEPGLRDKYGEGAIEAQPPVYKNLPGKPRTPATIPVLDVVLHALRSEFGEQFKGWSPAMGKNRIADGIEGRPGISGGGGGAPGLPDDTSIPATFAPRPNAGQEVRIGILDTRLYTHPALAGKHFTPDEDLLTDKELQKLSGSIRQAAGHATFIAGLIAERAPRAQLIIHHALNDEEATAPLWNAAKAMMKFESKVQILNMSWIYLTADHEPSLILSRAIDRLSPNTLLVAAAGNHGVVVPQPDSIVLPENRPVQPAAIPGVVAVGAFEHGKPAAFSPKKAPWISLGAPGSRVVSTYLKGTVKVDQFDQQGVLTGVQDTTFETGLAQWSGTSFATANVCGEIAARMTASRQRRPTAQEVADELMEGVADSDVQPYPRT